MILYFDNTGKLLTQLRHGTPARLGSSGEFSIYAYFDGINLDNYEVAELALKRPLSEGPFYENVALPYPQMELVENYEFIKEEDDGEIAPFVNGQTYNCFKYTFNISGILNVAGLWKASIILRPNTYADGEGNILQNVTGLFTFNVEGSTWREIDLSESEYWDEISSTLMRKKSGKYVHRVDNIASETLDTIDFKVGDVVYNSLNQTFYEITMLDPFAYVPISLGGDFVTLDTAQTITADKTFNDSAIKFTHTNSQGVIEQGSINYNPNNQALEIGFKNTPSSYEGKHGSSIVLNSQGSSYNSSITLQTTGKKKDGSEFIRLMSIDGNSFVSTKVKDSDDTYLYSDLGESGKPFGNLYLNGKLSDGTNEISIDQIVNDKQDKVIAGNGISISGNTISAVAGAGLIPVLIGQETSKKVGTTQDEDDIIGFEFDTTDTPTQGMIGNGIYVLTYGKCFIFLPAYNLSVSQDYYITGIMVNEDGSRTTGTYKFMKSNNSKMTISIYRYTEAQGIYHTIPTGYVGLLYKIPLN